MAMDLLNQYGLSERFLTQATMYPDDTLARIIAQYRGKYKIVTAQGEMLAELSGRLRYDTDELAMYPAVGDYVMARVAADSAVIHHVLTRKSLFVRKAVGVSGQAQPIAANVDVVFLCMSLNHNFNLNRMERYLSIAWDSGATPVVVLTKSDLCQDLNKAVEQVEKYPAIPMSLRFLCMTQMFVRSFCPISGRIRPARLLAHQVSENQRSSINCLGRRSTRHRK